jgi:hypothetical protein
MASRWPTEVRPLNGVAMGTVVWRMNLEGGPSAVHLTVVVQATFAYSDEGALELVAPAPLTRERGPAPVKMVAASSDLAPFLLQSDIWFTGHAHAVGHTARAVSVRLAVGRREPFVDKTLHVYGERRPGRHGLGPPRSFRRMAISYERAAGGDENPFGENHGVPNIVDPENPARPVGFGLIPPPWPARKRLRASGLRKRRRADEEPTGLSAPLMVVPVGFDWGYFQAAPADQRGPFLMGDEWVVLDGLHPTKKRITLQLPGLSACASFCWHGVKKEVALWADGLHVDGDHRRVTVRWRGCFEVERSEGLRDAVVEGAVLVDGQKVALSPDVLNDAARTETMDERDRSLLLAGPASTIPGGPWRVWNEELKAWVISETAEHAARRRALGVEAAAEEGWLRPGTIPGAPWCVRDRSVPDG